MEGLKSRLDRRCFLKAVIWFISNAAFGLAPLLFLVIINPLLKNSEATPEINNIIHGGGILFVCCALMGAIVIDVLQDKLEYNRIVFFFVNIAPFLMLGFLSITLLVSILGHLKYDLFGSFSIYYVIVISFTMFYCILCKYLLIINIKKRVYGNLA